MGLLTLPPDPPKIQRIIYTPIYGCYLYVQHGATAFGKSDHGKTYLIKPTADLGFELVEVSDFPEEKSNNT